MLGRPADSAAPAAGRLGGSSTRLQLTPHRAHPAGSAGPGPGSGSGSSSGSSSGSGSSSDSGSGEIAGPRQPLWSCGFASVVLAGASPRRSPRLLSADAAAAAAAAVYLLGGFRNTTPDLPWTPAARLGTRETVFYDVNSLGEMKGWWLVPELLMFPCSILPAEKLGVIIGLEELLWLLVYHFVESIQ